MKCIKALTIYRLAVGWLTFVGFYSTPLQQTKESVRKVHATGDVFSKFVAERNWGGNKRGRNSLGMVKRKFSATNRASEAAAMSEFAALFTACRLPSLSMMAAKRLRKIAGKRRALPSVLVCTVGEVRT
ncbi:MAG: hypothetical protein N2116_02390 [Armatimonadetes bacterium]|nr:hypothetical protein [Armatimonadota bacterium]